MKTALTPAEALRGLFLRRSARLSWTHIGRLLDVTPYHLRLQLDPAYQPTRRKVAVSRETSAIYD